MTEYTTTKQPHIVDKTDAQPAKAQRTHRRSYAGEAVQCRFSGTMHPAAHNLNTSTAVQHQGNATSTVLQTASPPNRTGLPDRLKTGIENLSGYAMDDVKVHYNSGKPAQLNALAYAQGNEIHLDSGQEKHLPHEAWHVVQQKQGRVKPTLQMMGRVNVNDDEHLEREADVMGVRALSSNRQEARDSIEEGNRLSVPVFQQVFASPVVQLIYLWDRSVDEEAPHWYENEESPEGYMESGRYNDEIHGDDKLYMRLGRDDLFYGINYSGDDMGAKIKAKKVSGKLKDIDYYKRYYEGGSGWENYSRFNARESEISHATVWVGDLERLNRGDNDLGFAEEADGVTHACQLAMIEAIAEGGSVRFILDGMKDIPGVLEGRVYTDRVTSGELRFAAGLIGKTIRIPAGRLPNGQVPKPREEEPPAAYKKVIVQDGVHVFFYRDREQVSYNSLDSLPDLVEPSSCCIIL